MMMMIENDTELILSQKQRIRHLEGHVTRLMAHIWLAARQRDKEQKRALAWRRLCDIKCRELTRLKRRIALKYNLEQQINELIHEAGMRL